jgi:hypothetical protein
MMAMTIPGSMNQYTVVARSILLRNEGEANASMQQLSKAATNQPTTTEKAREVQAPMKETTAAMKSSWIV